MTGFKVDSHMIDIGPYLVAKVVAKVVGSKVDNETLVCQALQWRP